MFHLLPLIVLGAFCAALLRGFTGFGFVMAAVPLLSLVLPPARVVPLTLLLQLAVGLIDVRSAARKADWRSLRWLAPGMVVGTPLGIMALTRLSAGSARLAIGALIVGSVIALVRGLRLAAHPPRAMTLTAGLISGLMNGLAGMSGPPVVTYLLALPNTTAVVRASLIVFFVGTATVGVVPMALHGLIDGTELVWSAASLPALFAGTRLGAWGFRRTSPRTHRRCAFTILLALAGLLILRGLVG